MWSELRSHSHIPCLENRDKGWPGMWLQPPLHQQHKPEYCHCTDHWLWSPRKTSWSENTCGSVYQGAGSRKWKSGLFFHVYDTTHYTTYIFVNDKFLHTLGEQMSADRVCIKNFTLQFATDIIFSINWRLHVTLWLSNIFSLSFCDCSYGIIT